MMSRYKKIFPFFLRTPNYMTKLIRGLMYGKPARVDAYFAKTTRRNTDNFWHGEHGRDNDNIDTFNNGNML